MQLIVLGMHRSGTSVLARILNLMGVYLGPEGMSTGANPENPKGFWERRDVRLLNDAVLHSIGCDWDRVADLDLARIPEEIDQAFNDVARRILLEMDAHRPWFIKEPRLCLLLPLWLRHLEVPIVVNIHRDPVEVSASLQRRNGMPMEAGLELWEFYTRAAATAAKGLPAVSVLHAELMADPEGVASRLYGDLVQLGVHGIRPPTAAELVGFIDPGLHRERGGRSTLDAHREGRQAKLYRALAEGGAVPPLDAASGDSWGALREYGRGLPPVEPPDPRKVRAAGYDAFMLDERIKSAVRRLNRLETGLKAGLQERIGRAVDQALARRPDTAPEPESSLDETIAARQRAESELEKRYVELAAAARELDAARKAAASLEAEAAKRLEKMSVRKADAETRLKDLQQQRARGLEQEQALRRQVDELESKLGWLRGERKRLSRSLERERERSARLQAELSRITGSRSWRMTAPLRSLFRRSGR